MIQVSTGKGRIGLVSPGEGRQVHMAEISVGSVNRYETHP